MTNKIDTDEGGSEQGVSDSPDLAATTSSPVMVMDSKIDNSAEVKILKEETPTIVPVPVEPVCGKKLTKIRFSFVLFLFVFYICIIYLYMFFIINIGIVICSAEDGCWKKYSILYFWIVSINT